MRIQLTCGVATLLLALGVPALAQSAPAADTDALAPAAVAVPQPLATEAGSPAVRMLEDFKRSDIRFNLDDLLDILRDHRHEGWVLAAYPDPRRASRSSGPVSASTCRRESTRSPIL